jgi:hypothetical protein
MSTNPANQTSLVAEKITSSLSNMYEQVKNQIANLDEEFQTYLLFMIIFIVVVMYLIYLSRLYSMPTRECDYMNRIYSDVNGFIVPVSKTAADFSGNLFDYYIKTAYNACSGGDYKNGYVDTCVLKAIIKQGVRCLDFEVYSIDNQPVVATSTQDDYFVKETFNYVPFGGTNSVMEVINSYAFADGTCPNPTDPIIIHLRIKSSNQTMYTNLAKIFSNYDKMLGYNYSFENTGRNLGFEPLVSFLGKIILIVDRSNNAFLQNEDFLEYVNMTSNSVFMRGYNYYDIKNNPDINELTEFNKMGMTIVFPNKGINPPNPSSMLSRIYGCQMVAMRYQYVDDYLLENDQFFDRGASAFVLKPQELRYVPLIIPDPVPQNPDYSFDPRTVENQYFDLQI